MARIELGDITLDVTFKDIKNVHLSVYPPIGRVRISAPKRMDMDTVRVFAISKLPWIRQQQKKIQDQIRETPREYLERESHWVWGKRYLLLVVESDFSSRVELKHRRMLLHVRPETSGVRRQEIVDGWYREQLKIALEPLIHTWEERFGVRVNRFFVQRMKTKWGSCNPVEKNLRFNTELAKKPKECLEYIVAHEMAHLREPRHNIRFTALLDQTMPNWQIYREQLNRLPIRHEDWAF